MSKTYSIMRFQGSSQSIETTESDRHNTVDLALKISKHTGPDTIIAVIDDDTDEAVSEGVFVQGKNIDHGLVRSFVFGLSRMV